MFRRTAEGYAHRLTQFGDTNWVIEDFPGEVVININLPRVYKDSGLFHMFDTQEGREDLARKIGELGYDATHIMDGDKIYLRITQKQNVDYLLVVI